LRKRALPLGTTGNPHKAAKDERLKG
jgi:hypothetical protein